MSVSRKAPHGLAWFQYCSFLCQSCRTLLTAAHLTSMTLLRSLINTKMNISRGLEELQKSSSVPVESDGASADGSKVEEWSLPPLL